MKNIFSVFILLFSVNFLFSPMLINANEVPPTRGSVSIDTGLTITKVRTAKNKGKTYIVASSYEGTVIGVSYSGKILWKNELAGFMNQDIWCQDITGDGNDEVLAANADGNLYCLNNKGEVLWKFKKDDTPMYAVCVIRKGKIPYVVCGGFNKSIYYLNSKGEEVKELKSETYSAEKVYKVSKYPLRTPQKKRHTPNFLRPIIQPDGTEILALLGVNNHMSFKGSMYLFKPMEDLPFRNDKFKIPRVVGDFKVIDMDEDGEMEVLLGNSAHTNDASFGVYYPKTGKSKSFKLKKIQTGYVVVQGEKIGSGKKAQYLILEGNKITLVNKDLNIKNAEILESKYAFNDLWKDPSNDKIILASCQSGGSAIHILDTKKTSWKKDFKNINPPGKIKQILSDREKVGKEIKKYQPIAEERKPLPVYLMSESYKSPIAKSVAENVKRKYKSPVFLSGKFMPKVQSPESWNRSQLANPSYRIKRDKRKKYVLSQKEVLSILSKEYTNSPGLATWGGHGNDPYFYSLDTKKKLIDIAKGKKTILLYPELEDHGSGFEFVLNDLIYPLAKHSQNKNANIFLRTKNVFWLGPIYQDKWERFLSGEFSDVFVPSMEETTDKTMELSIAGRLGIWTSGVVDNWGTRAVRDNTSFDRLREHSYQTVPNHYLRMLIYHVSYGATYLNNFRIDQDYMSVLWDLIAKGALYVPKKSEILSFSPVHLSMINPDKYFLDDGSHVKYTVKFDKEFEEKNPYVFSRMNGSWPGAQVTDWDFSRYAAGVTDRRLNFLAPYENGMVLITPPQKGFAAKQNQPRGKMTDHMHPFYKEVMNEYYTNGKSYFSKDGTQEFPANEYYKIIEKDIKESSKILPITVSGEVAWVVAQSSPKHLRLTLVESGYINPKDRVATISFNNIKPVKIIDLLSKETFKVDKTGVSKIKIPLGTFRFLDIELQEEFVK